MASIAALWRARLNRGSVAMESKVTKGNTTLRTLPESHSRPTSGPPYETIVRSASSERRIALTAAMGLRRDPHPPMPMVMPLVSSPTSSSRVARLSLIELPPSVHSLRSVSLSLFDECSPLLVGHAPDMEFIGETLF